MYGIIATAPHGIGSPFSLTALKSFRLYPNAPQPEQRYRPIQAVNAYQSWVWVSIMHQDREHFYYFTPGFGGFQIGTFRSHPEKTLWRTIGDRGRQHDLEISTALTLDGVVHVDHGYGVRRFGGRCGSTFLDSEHGIRTHDARRVRLDLSDRVSPPVVAASKN
jgi:hypothetical protein